jgi:hypothetical protein
MTSEPGPITELERFAIRAARLAAFGVPLVLGVFAASPEPYWLDSPEFTAAAQTLGIPHPPGHPLWVMLVKPFTLLPLGGIALRVALASALFSALAALLLHLLIERLIAVAAPLLGRIPAASIALAGTLTAAVSVGWWFQGVRAEVYSLQILLVLGSVYPLARFCTGRAPADDRLLHLAAFAFGLSLCNHHFIALAALPAAVPPLVALARTRGGLGALSTVARLAGISATGLLPYLFLPLRSAAGAPVALGGVHSAADMAWVVSARVYQKSMAREHAQALGERSLDAVFTMMGELTPVVVVAALAGCYLLLRGRRSRVAGAMLALLAGVTILLRSIMGFDPFNPDYYGYMLPAVSALAAAGAVFAAVALDVLGRLVPRGRWLAALLAAAVLALPVLQARRAHPRVDLSDFKATRLFTDLALDTAEPGTLVLTSHYKLFFVLWSAGHVDGTRPDVTVVNPHLFGYPGYLHSTLAARPDLRGLAWSMVVAGHLTESAVADLALNGPLRIEPDPGLEPAVLRHLLPDGAVYTAVPEPLGQSDAVAASPAHHRRWRGFYEILGTGWREHETWRMLSWCHYLDALFLAGRGDRDGARRAVALARSLGSEAPQIAGLEQALEDQVAKGPLDVSPFLPAALPPARPGPRD